MANDSDMGWMVKKGDAVITDGLAYRLCAKYYEQCVRPGTAHTHQNLDTIMAVCVLPMAITAI